MQALAEVVLPVFLVLGAGWGLALRGVIGAAEVDGLMRFAQGIALPCLLFSALARLDLAASFDLRLLAAFYGGVAAAFAAGVAAARLALGRSWPDAVAIGFAAAFSNSLLLGLPITARAYGEAALAGNYAIIALHAPVLYATGITAMEIARSRGQGLAAGAVAVKAGRAVLVQPLVIGILAGAAVNLTGLPLPGPLDQALSLVGGAALPLALFGLGGVLARYRVAGDGRAIALVCTLSLALHPAFTWALGQALALPVEALRSAVVTAAMAPGVNAYLFAHSYGAATRVAASAVLFATAACVATAWVWLAILP
jgi:hypothetical protein